MTYDPTNAEEATTPMTSTGLVTVGGFTLRDAAALMRERAERATARVCPEWIYSAVRHIARNCDIECYHDDDRECEQWSRYDDSAHIAGMDPLVALGVADWLDAIATRIPEIEPHYEHLLDREQTAAVAVARRYLGEAP